MNKNRNLLRLLAALLAIVVIAAACGDDSGDAAEPAPTTTAATATEDTTAPAANDMAEEAEEEGGRLAAVVARGELNCGVNATLPGFGNIDADGNNTGFDVDFCRVVAAAVLGDADAVSYTPLDSTQRFPTLQAGEIDVLIRNTTWTASRDGNEQANFMFTTFYDGQGFMVHGDSSIQSVEDMSNASICVLQGTTTLLNLNAVFGDRGIPFTAVEFQSNDELQPAFVAGQCEVWTTDSSGLAAFSATLGIPTRILSDIISKEPLGPVVADGDTEWAQVVNWATMATVQAEEYGITSSNISSFADTEDSNIRRFLGLEIEGEVTEFGLGIPDDFASQIISQVGNYGEIYERNLAPLGLERERNALWTDGGLMYVPPFR
ncbi:MAG: amino acid ABC transporter substrate-binding protein [Acidimicrobiaceae bacterium]|nr:amino acid ABC transporter substrate-binding protein [Acidimicrobiia bacterium]MCY4493217.1 amino acid ABC transporter substrate-binding protein [Acidimicrobiaceae bacterium]